MCGGFAIRWPPALTGTSRARTASSIGSPWIQTAISVVNTDPAESVRSLKAKPGKDIWLFGGGELFRTLLEAGLVDTVEPAVVPVLLGAGIPMLPSPTSRTKLSLSGHRLYPKSGIVLLEYAVDRSP